MYKKKQVLTETGISSLKGLIGAIPFAGTALNEVLFEARTRIKQNRINKFIISLSEYLEEINCSKLNLEHIKSEDFSDLFEDLIIAVSKTKSNEKILAFRNLIANNLIEERDNEFTQLILNVTVTLNFKQIIFLNELHKISNHLDENPSLSIDTLINKINDLENKLRDFYFGKKSKVENEKKYVCEIKKEIKEIKKQLKAELDLIHHLERICDPRFYNCSQFEFEFYSHDLISKGLIINLRKSYNSNTVELFTLTEFGSDVINILTEKKPAANKDDFE